MKNFLWNGDKRLQSRKIGADWYIIDRCDVVSDRVAVIASKIDEKWEGGGSYRYLSAPPPPSPSLLPPPTSPLPMRDRGGRSRGGGEWITTGGPSQYKWTQEGGVEWECAGMDGIEQGGGENYDWQWEGWQILFLGISTAWIRSNRAQCRYSKRETQVNPMLKVIHRLKTNMFHVIY